MNTSTDSPSTLSRKRPRTVTGVVSSDKMNRTRSITVVRLVQHPLYKKYVRRRTTYKAHDEHNTSRLGDKVVIAQTRPLSKTKSWRLVEVLERAKTRGARDVSALEPDVTAERDGDSPSPPPVPPQSGGTVRGVSP